MIQEIHWDQVSHMLNVSLSQTIVSGQIFDTMKFHNESEVLFSNLEKREQVLLTMSSKPSEPHAYDKYFVFKENHKTFTFERNIEAINQTISTFGYFLILTTDYKFNSNEVLEIYQRKDVVEKVIKELSKIRVVHLSNGTSLLNPITKKQ